MEYVEEYIEDMDDPESTNEAVESEESGAVKTEYSDTERAEEYEIEEEVEG